MYFRAITFLLGKPCSTEIDENSFPSYVPTPPPLVQNQIFPSESKFNWLTAVPGKPSILVNHCILSSSGRYLPRPRAAPTQTSPEGLTSIEAMKFSLDWPTL